MIYIGEGLIPQIEAGANKYVYSTRIHPQLFNQIMSDMREKSQDDTGNKWIIVCNSVLWDQVNMTLGEYLANYQTDGTYLYSKDANKGSGGYIKVGNTYSSYEFA